MLADEWARVFGNCAPAGFLCRVAMSDRWLRIHSLPESKRYASRDSDYAVILGRHNEVADELLGEGEPIVIFRGQFITTRSSVLPSDLPGVGVDTFRVDALTTEVPGMERLIGFVAAETRWKAGEFDTLIRARSDDVVGPLLFANLGKRTAYAPYDGGADLFFATAAERDAARIRWGDWLSKHPDGV